MFVFKYCISLKNDFVLASSADPDEMPHFIKVFIVCHSTGFGVSSPQRVNVNTENISLSVLDNFIGGESQFKSWTYVLFLYPRNRVNFLHILYL